MDITYVPILFLFISVILLIFTVFWLFYYNTKDNWPIILFSIGILLGLIACIMLIYLRWPGVLKNDEKIDILIQK